MSASLRPAAVAGTFYPADGAALASQVDHLLAAVPPHGGAAPKAIIAPHAGYAYSGPTAAAVYAWLRPARGVIRRVVLIGPAHRVPFRGLALSGADALDTPLGQVPVDVQGAAIARALPCVQVHDAAHALEHSLEVHLPFLRAVLGEISVIPLLAGDCTDDDVANVLESLWGGPETLIVISSDLSHFLDYDACKQRDARTAAAIERLDGTAISFDDACGRLPIGGLLRVAGRRGMTVERVDIRSSGDTGGSRDRVVGYGAWAFHAAAQHKAPEDDSEARQVIQAHGPALVALARESIAHGLSHGTALAVRPEDWTQGLQQPMAAFVTLTNGPQKALRGCIGSAQAWRPLVVDVAANAFKAAFEDPRFPPLCASRDSGPLWLSVSVLDQPRPLVVRDEADLLAQLRPGLDGLILNDGGRRGLFLPSVWDALPDPGAFLVHLRRKAGLADDHWSETQHFERFGSHSAQGACVVASTV